MIILLPAIPRTTLPLYSKVRKELRIPCKKDYSPLQTIQDTAVQAHCIRKRGNQLLLTATRIWIPLCRMRCDSPKSKGRKNRYRFYSSSFDIQAKISF